MPTEPVIDIELLLQPIPGGSTSSSLTTSNQQPTTNNHQPAVHPLPVGLFPTRWGGGDAGDFGLESD
jgi:hypothetical protein